MTHSQLRFKRLQTGQKFKNGILVAVCNTSTLTDLKTPRAAVQAVHDTPYGRSKRQSGTASGAQVKGILCQADTRVGVAEC